MTIKCNQCLKERPESEMRQVTITRQKFDFRTRKKYVASDKMWFCKDTSCAGHYQMGCEG